MSEPADVKHVSYAEITVSENATLNWKGPTPSNRSYIKLTRGGETEFVTDEQLTPGSKEVKQGDFLEILAMIIYWS